VISDAEVKTFFAPKQHEPKPTYSDKAKKWAIGMLTAEPQYKRSLPSDYKREIERQSNLAKAKRSEKQISQLGEQKNQSVPPLIVGPPSSPPPISIRPSEPILIWTVSYWTPE
jgi:hypothetical protein